MKLTELDKCHWLRPTRDQQSTIGPMLSRKKCTGNGKKSKRKKLRQSFH